MASGPFVIDRGVSLAGAAGSGSNSGVGPADLGDVAGLVVRCLGGIAAAASAACGGVLLVRRLTAAITDIPGPAVLLAVAGLGGLLVIAADIARRHASGPLGPVVARIGFFAALAAVAVPPETVAGGIVIVAALAIAAAATLHRPGRIRTTDEPPHTLRAAATLDLPRRAGRRTDLHEARLASPPSEVHHRRRRAPGRTRQRFERYEMPGGGDSLRGRITITVPAGAKSAHGHVGFCPAFGETPRVSVTTDYDGVEATVLAAEVLPWGVRIECRLAEPAEEPLEIPVDLTADAVAQV